MTKRRAGHPPSAAGIPDESQPVNPLCARLQASSKEHLIALVERLASDSEELAVRIDYLTDSSKAVQTLQRQIAALRRGTAFIDYRATREAAHEIRTILSDIEADILPGDPAGATALAEKLIGLDQKIFDRADDSGGVIGGELRDACVLWLKAAAASRHAGKGSAKDSAKDWAGIVYDLHQANDYGVREPLLSEAHILLTEPELRALAARFEREASEALQRARDNEEKFHRVFTPTVAMGLVAEALRDPVLHEQSIRIHSPEPNALQSVDIAAHYLDCGDAAGALRWLQSPWEDRFEHQRLDLLDRAYALLGDTARQIEIRRARYERARSIHSYRELEALLPAAERAALRARALEDARSNPHLVTAAELLFAIEEAALAEQLIVERATDLS